jgi:ribosomal-protein-serine acetyltransferase
VIPPRDRIPTARLVLEPVHPGLADAIWEATRVSLPELRQWLAWAVTARADQTRAYTEEAVRSWEEGTDFSFAVLAGNEVVGGIGCHRAILARMMGELGYWLRTDRTGRGYATEAGEAVVRWAFDTFGFGRMELRAGVENLPSQRVAERLGFRREGLLRSGCPHPEGGYDCYIYGLVRSDL